MIYMGSVVAPEMYAVVYCVDFIIFLIRTSQLLFSSNHIIGCRSILIFKPFLCNNRIGARMIANGADIGCPFGSYFRKILRVQLRGTEGK